ncbi:IDEAL domain-containing protein [Aeribacillus alveayuensis]|uniref:Uncharacterized protein YpiB (UPF0302 family) n=1 Tax=Aeribacillus alveayuensis TaxID=279215 RepID=A0ABT9VMZ5_9BACI|nr:uncharacterized protein YpiB (UPF0302 family) [Bacillus alveayuensis]
MKERKSYTEIMKARSAKVNAENFMMDVYIQMVLDEAVFNYKKLKLEEKINEALDRYDKESFQKLSEEYVQLLKYA